MKKRAVSGFCFALLSCAAASFSGEITIDFDGPESFNLAGAAEVPEVPVVAPPKAAAFKEGEREWTIMVFMNGKNDLQNSTVADINRMEEVGSTPRISVTAEVGRSTPVPKNVSSGKPVYPEGGSDWKEVRRYFIRNDSDPDTITSPLVEILPQTVDMGSWKHLAEFGKWAKEKYPAKNYMLIVWSHGYGWKSPDGPLYAQNISFDDENDTSISPQELGMALEEMGGVDVYASDACLMQQAEVAYELREHARVIIGSEETLPAKGYPYSALLSALNSAADLTPEIIGKLTVENYEEYHKNDNPKDYGPAILSAIRAYELPALRKKLDLWVELVRAKGDVPSVSRALDNSLYFSDNSESKDLVHFVGIASSNSRFPEIKDAGAEIINFMKERVVIANTNLRAGYENANGLSAYFPVAAYDRLYSRLAWSEEGKWDDLIRWFHRKYFNREE